MAVNEEPRDGTEGHYGNVVEVGDGNHQVGDIGNQNQDQRQRGQNPGQQDQDLGQQDGNHRPSHTNQGRRSRCKTFTAYGFVALLAASIPAALQVGIVLELQR